MQLCTSLTLFHDHLQIVELVAETLSIVRSSTLQSHNSWNEESGEHFVEHCTTFCFIVVDDEQIRLVFERVYDSKFEN
jgi:hypothetical protein